MPTTGIIPLLTAVITAATAGAALARSPAVDETSVPAALQTPAVVRGFPGISQYPTLDGDAEKPSDVHIAVGPGRDKAGRIVQVSNNGIQIFDKTGATIAGPVPLESFAGVGADRCFDPKIIYDQEAERFFVVMPETKSSRSSSLHVAVSTTSAPTALEEGWLRVSDSAVTTFEGKATWLDYPCPGGDSASLFVTGNMCDDNKRHLGSKIRVFDKRQLLEGVSSFTDLDFANRDFPEGGTFTLQPAHVFGATTGGHFFLISRCGPEAFRLWEIGGTPGAPRVLANGIHPWTGGTQLRTGAPQKGNSGVTLHTSSGRIMNALWKAGSIWCVATADVNSDSRAEVAWFRIGTGHGIPARPVILDSGTIAGSDEAAWTFVPSIGISASGHAAVCYAQSSPDQYVQIRAALRGSDDPPGRFRASRIVHESAGEYDNMDRHNPEKWADYSACVVDPDDGESFWIAHEFCNVPRRNGDDAQWGTWIALLAPVGE